MFRNLRMLGLAVLVTLALTVLGAGTAGSAAASGETFRSTQHHVILSLHGTISFTFPGGWVYCKTLSAGATLSIGTSSSAMTSEGNTYTGCTTKTIFGTINATVNFKGCDFLLTADTATQTHIVCPAGTGPITIEGPGCSITIGAQTVNGVTYSNSGSHVNINTNVTNVTSTATGFFCSATGTSNTGTISGTATVKGATTAGAAVTVSYS